MSKTISSFLTKIEWGVEGTVGVKASTFPYLWNSQDSDSLTQGESPFDERPLVGVRGQGSTNYRRVQNLPGGGLGNAPVKFQADSQEVLEIMLAHFQKVTEAGSVSPFTYTFTPVTEALDEADFNTLSFQKDVGVATKAHFYLGCVVDSLNISYTAGEPIKWTPTVKALSSGVTGTMGTNATLTAGGFLQAPNIAVTFDGTAIHPSAFSITSNANYPDRQAGSARGRYAWVVGDYNISINMSVWRNEDSDGFWVNPFVGNAVKDLVITAEMDSAYGTTAVSENVTFTMTAKVMLDQPADLPVGTGDLIDDVTFRVVNDTPITFALTAASTGLVE